MPSKTWTDATIDFFDFQADNLTPALAWPASMNGDTGISPVTAPPGVYMYALGTLQDNGSLPAAIVTSNLRIEFDYAVTTAGDTASPSWKIGSNTPYDPHGPGDASGHYLQDNDSAAYLGGTDRAFLFIPGGMVWAFTNADAATVMTSARVVISHFTVTVTYTTGPGSAPHLGRTQGGTRVVITPGADFGTTPTVTFDGIAATGITILSAVEIACRTPAHAAGAVDVVVNGTITLAGAFTYVAAAFADVSMRREPTPTIDLGLHVQADRAAFRVGALDDPSLGALVRFVDPASGETLFAGTVLKQTTMFEGRPISTQLARDLEVGDLTWRLNARRPRGTFTDTSATTVAHWVVDTYAPGFTGNAIQAGLPTISVKWTRKKTVGECLDEIAALVAGTWYVDNIDVPFDVHLYTGTEASTPPDDVTPDNPDLCLDGPPLSLTEDLRQEINRVWVRGAGAGDSAEGALGPPNPLNGTTYTQTTGGSIPDGTSYRYFMTTLTATGESVPSNATSAGWVLAAGKNAFDITGLDATIWTTDPRVVGRKLYRSKATPLVPGEGVDLTTGYLVATLGNTADGTDDAVFDGKSDADLGEAMPKQDTTATILVMVEDPDAQAALAALIDDPLEDGVREEYLEDPAFLTSAQAEAAGRALLDQRAPAIKTLTYATRDLKSKKGAIVHADLTPQMPIVGDFQIQAVAIDQIDLDAGHQLRPKLAITAGSQLTTIEDVLRGRGRGTGDGGAGGGAS